jgi:hypothetical protein
MIFPSALLTLAFTIQMAVPPANEFSRTINIASLGRKATRNALTADADECAALASRFDLGSLGSLDANVSCAVVDPRRMRVRAKGTFTARDVVVEREATVQAERVAFETYFVGEDGIDQSRNSKYESGADDSYDEPIVDGTIDMGELVAQHLYLYLSEARGVRDLEFEEATPGSVVYDTDDED